MRKLEVEYVSLKMDTMVNVILGLHTYHRRFKEALEDPASAYLIEAYAEGMRLYAEFAASEWNAIQAILNDEVVEKKCSPVDSGAASAAPDSVR